MKPSSWKKQSVGVICLALLLVAIPARASAPKKIHHRLRVLAIQSEALEGLLKGNEALHARLEVLPSHREEFERRVDELIKNGNAVQLETAEVIGTPLETCQTTIESKGVTTLFRLTSNSLGDRVATQIAYSIQFEEKDLKTPAGPVLFKDGFESEINSQAGSVTLFSSWISDNEREKTKLRKQYQERLVTLTSTIDS